MHNRGWSVAGVGGTVRRVSASRVQRASVEGWTGYEVSSGNGDLRVTVIPELAMLGVSLRHRGEEMLGRRGGVGAYADRGSTMGIPLLYPWANRLSDLAAAGLMVDRESSLVRIDVGTGLPIHGLSLRRAPWSVRVESTGRAATVAGTLSFDSSSALGRAFPYPHTLEVGYRMGDAALDITTTVVPTGAAALPISFGFHPYFAPPGAPRSRWELRASVTSRLELDDRVLPTGRVTEATGVDGPLGDRVLDDAFTVRAPAEFVLSAGDREILVRFGPGYPITQLYAPMGEDLIAIEPMTAPADALVTRGSGLREVRPGERFSAGFSIAVR